MRCALDWLYRASGALGAMFLVAICGIVLAQVGANVIDALAAWITGHPIGLVIPSYADFAGFFLAASSFLALPYALRHGAHIRVTLLLQGLPAGVRRWFEVWCTLVGTAMAGYAAWYMSALVAESWRFGDVSPGLVAVPLWLPQSGMALGLIVLTVALADDLVATLRGRTPSFEAAEAAGEGVLE